MSSSQHPVGSFERKNGLSVTVRNGNIEQAIRVLGKKVKQDGLVKELRDRSFFEKPSAAKRRRKAEAVSRQRKVTRDQERLVNPNPTATKTPTRPASR